MELNGTFGRWSGRGLWISEIENTGDNGPLFLLDISLPPIWNAGKYRYIYLSHDSGWQWLSERSLCHPNCSAGAFSAVNVAFGTELAGFRPTAALKGF